MSGESESVEETEEDLAEVTTPKDMWAIILHCKSEEMQAELLNRFIDEGLECKALI